MTSDLSTPPRCPRWTSRPPPGRTYRYRPTDAKHDPLVLFGFGRGMSYAQFSYSLAPTTAQPLPSIAASAAAEPPVVQVGIVVSRSATDHFPGQPAAEVVLAFFEPQESQSRSSSNRLPMRRALFDFAKVQLPPGGKKTVYFKISAKALVSAPQPVVFCNRCVCPRCNHRKSPSAGAGGDNGIDHSKELTEISLRFYIFAIPLSPPAPVRRHARTGTTVRWCPLQVSTGWYSRVATMTTRRRSPCR
eukprot:COSAG01_NODE_340_length_18638_cov_56.516505_20_plen_246_part_00